MLINNRIKINNTSGVMLIELMISVAISIALLTLLLSIYVGVQRSYQLQSALHTIVRQSRSVTALFRSEIHQAGNIGCAQLTADFPVKSFGQYSLSVANKLIITPSGFTVKYMAFPGVIIKEDMQHLSTLTVDTSTSYHAGDVMIVADCFHAEIFILKSVYKNSQHQVLTSLQPLHDLYGKYATVSRLISHSYFIAASKGGDGDALVVEDIKHRKTEMISSVGRLRLRSKKNTDGELSGIEFEFESAASGLHKTWYSFVSL